MHEEVFQQRALGRSPAVEVPELFTFDSRSRSRDNRA